MDLAVAVEQLAVWPGPCLWPLGFGVGLGVQVKPCLWKGAQYELASQPSRTGLILAWTWRGFSQFLKLRNMYSETR